MRRQVDVVQHLHVGVDVLVGSRDILIVDLDIKFELRWLSFVRSNELVNADELLSVELQLTDLVTASGLIVVETVRFVRWFDEKCFK